MTDDTHVRIREAGETEDLPALAQWIVYPHGATPDEEHEVRRRQKEYNDRVAAELARKFGGLW